MCRAKQDECTYFSKSCTLYTRRWVCAIHHILCTLQHILLTTVKYTLRSLCQLCWSSCPPDTIGAEIKGWHLLNWATAVKHPGMKYCAEHCGTVSHCTTVHCLVWCDRAQCRAGQNSVQDNTQFSLEKQCAQVNVVYHCKQFSVYHISLHIYWGQ